MNDADGGTILMGGGDDVLLNFELDTGDAYYVDLGDGDDTTNLWGFSASLTLTLLAGKGDDDLTLYLFQAGEARGGKGNDSFHLVSLGALDIFGDAGNDTFTISGDVSLLEVHGGKGNDTFVVDADGTMFLYGGLGDDVVTITSDGEYANLVEGGWGDDELIGGDGDDNLFGLAHHNPTVLTKKERKLSDDDILSAGAGSDTLYGGFGDDTLSGGGTDGVRDQFFYRSHEKGGQDTITDFEDGVDRIYLQGRNGLLNGVDFADVVHIQTSGADAVVIFGEDETKPNKAWAVITLTGMGGLIDEADIFTQF